MTTPILTNMFQFYALPHIALAVQSEFPGHGVPNDYDMAVALPFAGAGAGAVTREYVTGPMPKSGTCQFGQVTQEAWAALKTTSLPSEQGPIISQILQDNAVNMFPTKQVRI